MAIGWVDLRTAQESDVTVDPNPDESALGPDGGVAVHIGRRVLYAPHRPHGLGGLRLLARIDGAGAGVFVGPRRPRALAHDRRHAGLGRTPVVRPRRSVAAPDDRRPRGR